MAVPPPASWTRQPESIYATNEYFTVRWWCGGSQDVVNGCTVTIKNGGTTAFTTNVTTMVDTYVWQLSQLVSSMGLTAGTTYTIEIHGYNDDGDGESISATFQVYARPTVSINSPSASEVVDGLPLTIAWSASDATGIAQQSLVLVDSSYARKLNVTLDGSVRSYVISPEDAVLDNNESYRLYIGATNGVGLSDQVMRQFTTEWAPPAAPTATIEVDEDSLGTTITVVAGEDISFAELDAPATESMSIARVDADGNRWVIATGLSSGAVVHDPLPPLGVTYTYEITAVSNTGATSVGAVDMTITTGYWAFNFGAQATEHAKLRFNAKTSMSTTHGSDSYHFADGGQGNGLPVYYATTDRDISGSGSWDTVGPQEADRINALTLRYPVGWMRDPYGHRYRAHMSWSIDHGLPASRVWAISMDWDAVRWQEAW